MATTAMLLLFVCMVSCTKQKGQVVTVLTSVAEAAMYADVFNSTHEDVFIALRYAADCAEVLNNKSPSQSAMSSADVVMGTHLETTVKRFETLQRIAFNTCIAVYSVKNASFVTNGERGTESITIDELRDACVRYDDFPRRVGFVPQANEAFLALAGKVKSRDSAQYLSSFPGGDEGVRERTDFAYKYLSAPALSQIASGKCLFAVSTSDVLFRSGCKPSGDTVYRYIVDEEGYCVANAEVVMLGVLKSSKHKKAARYAAQWLMSAEAQEEIIRQKKKVPLETATFGIAGGFSYIDEVNEQIMDGGNLPRIRAEEHESD